RRPAVSTRQSTSARRRTMAEPTMPRCPATSTRLPARSNTLPVTSAPPTGSVVAVATLLLGTDRADVGLHHFLHEVVEACPVLPAQLGSRLAGITYQHVALGRSEIARVDLDQHRAGRRIEALLLGAGAAPADVASDAGERPLHELAHRVALAG